MLNHVAPWDYGMSFFIMACDEAAKFLTPTEKENG
jgi:hypothetical protein